MVHPPISLNSIDIFPGIDLGPFHKLFMCSNHWKMCTNTSLFYMKKFRHTTTSVAVVCANVSLGSAISVNIRAWSASVWFHLRAHNPPEQRPKEPGITWCLSRSWLPATTILGPCHQGVDLSLNSLMPWDMKGVILESDNLLFCLHKAHLAVLQITCVCICIYLHLNEYINIYRFVTVHNVSI